MAFKINHLHIKTSDPQKTVKWFVDNLGAKIVAEHLSAETVGFRVDLHGLRLNVTGFVKGQRLEQHFGMEHWPWTPTTSTTPWKKSKRAARASWSSASCQTAAASASSRGRKESGSR